MTKNLSFIISYTLSVKETIGDGNKAPCDAIKGTLTLTGWRQTACITEIKPSHLNSILLEYNSLLYILKEVIMLPLNALS